MSVPTAQYPYQYPDQTQAKLASSSKAVKNVFDTFAVLILIATVLVTVGLFIGAAAEHQSYINDYDNYSDETAALVIMGFLAPLYGAFLWGSVKIYAVVAGYIHWRAK